MSRAPYRKAVALLPNDADTKFAKVAFDNQTPIPIFMPNGRFLEPRVVDAIESTSHPSGEWHPNSHRTRLLLACAHACKDIATCARSIDAENPWKERRAVALLATPLISLCDHAKDLYAALGPEKEARRSWPKADQDLLREAGRRLKRHQDGPLRTLRNKRTAHHDLDVLRLEAERLPALQDLILPPLADNLLVLLLSFNYRRVFTWTRKPVDAEPDEIEIMTEYPLAIRAKLDAGGAIRSLGAQSNLAEDPRGPLRQVVLDLFPVYNFLASKADPAHRTIFWRPMVHEE